uniref:Uncharacterized protein n=1 Tax=Oryza glumipatula TaxID=40148 RepID=A0A0E0AT74_9ORYZ
MVTDAAMLLKDIIILSTGAYTAISVVCGFSDKEFIHGLHKWELDHRSIEEMMSFFPGGLRVMLVDDNMKQRDVLRKIVDPD